MEAAEKEAITKVFQEMVVDEVQGKKFYLSKTLWVNVVAAVAIAVQTKYGFAIGPEYQTIIVALLNLVLRSVTKEKIVWF